MFIIALSNRFTNNSANMFNSDSANMLTSDSLNIFTRCSSVLRSTCSQVPQKLDFAVVANGTYFNGFLNIRIFDLKM